MIAHEGKSIILFVITMILIAVVFGWGFNLEAFRLVSVLLMLFLLFCINFFRDPEREIPVGDNLVLSPADGKVVDISQTAMGERKISLFLSVFDVHRNRSPINGQVTLVNYSKGRFLAAFKSQASEINEHNDVEIESEFGVVRVRQIAGLLARRIICHLNEGQEVKRGESLGFIRFGSRTELLIPKGTRIFVEVGDHVKGGSSVIGELT